MPPKRKTTAAVKTTAKTTPKVEQDKDLFNTNKMNMKLFKLVEGLTKNIDTMVSAQETFNNNFSLLQNYTTQELNEMDFQLKLQVEECENKYNDTLKQHNEKVQLLENQYKEREYTIEQEFIRKTDDLERDLTNRGFELASEIVRNSSKTIINNDEYTQLTNSVNSHKSEIERITTELNDKCKRDTSAALNTMKLQHQVDSSNMKATIEQQIKEISRLEDTINTLKLEIQAQRKLTESVANAGQKSVTQNFGK